MRKTIPLFIFLLLVLAIPAGASAQESRQPINGGVLNSKAQKLPAPAYPSIAEPAKAAGQVTVAVTVDESGCVIKATAIDGHELLLAAAVSAARLAEFAPTKLNDEPVQVTGILVYKFTVPQVAQKE